MKSVKQPEASTEQTKNVGQAAASRLLVGSGSFSRQAPLQRRIAAIVLQAHLHLLAVELAPVIVLMISERILRVLLKHHDERNIVTVDLTVFDAAFDAEEAGGAKKLRALGLEQK